MADLQSLLQNLSQKRVFLLGDVYLYETIFGEVEKLAEDAPVPVVQNHHRSQMAGGAGYTAILLSRLGIKVDLFTVLGDDPAGRQLMDIFKEHDINTDCVLVDGDYRTSSRTRVRVEGSKYSERDIINIHSTDPLLLSEEKKEYFSDYIEKNLEQCSAVVLHDMDCSIVTPKLLEELHKVTRKSKVPFIGTSGKQLGLYKKFDSVTATVKSAQNLLDGKRKKTDQLGVQLRSRLKCRNVYVPLAKEGISVVTEAGDVKHYPGNSKHVQDWTGSDQAVLTAVTAGRLVEWDPEDTAALANMLTTLVVSRPGYSRIEKRDLLTAEKQSQLNDLSGKHVNTDQLKEIVDRAKADGKKVVWTNGCYDILHAGHVIYLEQAKQLGDVLVVGLNSDASVKKNKGDLRPVVEENERAKVLSSLYFVDYVVVFDDISPVNMIAALKPSIYAKGGDYNIDTINQDERRIVESYGGEIALLPGVPGMSTSEIINRILKAYGGEEE